jgi:hypothetical protein
VQSTAENGETEPESKDEDSVDATQTSTGVELGDEIRVRLFQDRTGDAVPGFFQNVTATSGPALIQEVFEFFQLDPTTYSPPTLNEFLDALAQGAGLPLDGDPFTGSGPQGGATKTDVGGEGNDLFLYGTAGSLAEDRDCFDTSSGAADLGIVWALPVDHANEIQSDSISLDIRYYTEQCRHNDGSGMGNT